MIDLELLTVEWCLAIGAAPPIGAKSRSLDAVYEHPRWTNSIELREQMLLFSAYAAMTVCRFARGRRLIPPEGACSRVQLHRARMQQREWRDD
jgi:hypothetical protein